MTHAGNVPTWWAFVRGELKEQGDGDTPCGLVAFACWQQSKSDCQQCHKNGSIHCDDLYSVFCGILP